MDTFFAILLSGVLATLFWITVMFTFSWKGFHHGDMISVVGSDITNKPKLYFSRGIFLYIITGLILAPAYYFILTWFEFTSVINNIGVSVFMGISQGFLLMHLFVEEPSMHHPPKLLKKFFIPISVGHWFGHMAYGAAIGGLLSSYLIYKWDGLAISGIVILSISLFISYFVMRGAHKQRVAEKERSESHVSEPAKSKG